MKKLVAISLLQTCMIAGLPRSPVEGVQTVPKDEADRLIDSGMAELAEIDGGEVDEDDRDDHLESKSVKQLKAIAKQMGLTIATGATKLQLVDAIRAGIRDEARTRLGEFDRAKLNEIAASEGVEVADDASDDQVREAIFDHTFPPAE